MRLPGRPHPATALALLALGGFLLGCPGSIDDPSAFFDLDGGARADAGADAGRGCDAPGTIFMPVCGGCHHAQPGELGQLDLTSPGLNGRLVGVGSAGCGSSKVLVVAGQPDASYLFTKVASPTPSCGAQMPLGGSLNPDQIQCVSDWITALGSN